MARMTLLAGFVTGSLFIHNIQPLTRTISSGKETLKKRLTRQTSATTKAHAHGALLTDTARTSSSVSRHFGAETKELGTHMVHFLAQRVPL